MKKDRPSCRNIKQVFAEILKTGNQESISAQIREYPPRQAVNALMSFIYHGVPSVRWGAIIAIGEVVGLIASEDIEYARIIIRRLMWNLNDESGGIGWGSPEAMAEILAGNRTLAVEYHRLLLSYASKQGNFQENEIIQRGVLWGINRVAEKYPDLVKGADIDILGFLGSEDPVIRAYTARIVGLLGLHEARPVLERLMNDDSEIQVFIDQKLINRRVRDMANEAVYKLSD